MPAIGTERFVMQKIHGEWHQLFYGDIKSCRQYVMAYRTLAVEIWDFEAYKSWKCKEAVQ